MKRKLDAEAIQKRDEEHRAETRRCLDNAAISLAVGGILRPASWEMKKEGGRVVFASPKAKDVKIFWCNLVDK